MVEKLPEQTIIKIVDIDNGWVVETEKLFAGCPSLCSTYFCADFIDVIKYLEAKQEELEAGKVTIQRSVSKK